MISLGLDLGVGSIGWSLVREEEDALISGILKMGVRTISYPTFVKSSDGKSPHKVAEEFLKGVGLSSNAGRTKMHGMRIRLQRYKLRRKHLRNVLEKNGIISKTTLLCEDGPNTTHETYSFRAKAVEEEITLEQLARVLMMINKKRGFKSNRKDAGDDEKGKQSEYKQSLNQRSEMLREKNLTVGQLKYQTLKENPHFCFRDMVFYRQDYLDEFEKIWETQSKFHPELTNELKEEIRDLIIFHQRKLRSQKSSVSPCRFESHMEEVVVDKTTGQTGVRSVGCKVAPKSSPLFQEFRIWQNLNNLMLSDYVNHTVSPLSLEDKKRLFEKLSFNEKMKKNEALKTINKNPKEYDLNYEELEGNRTFFKILKVFEEWINTTVSKPYKFKNMKVADILSVLEPFLENNNVSKDLLRFDSTLEGKNLEKQPSYNLWHILYSYEADESRSGNGHLIEILFDKFGLPFEIGEKLAKINFEPDYGSLSAKAIRKLLPRMREGLRYDEACSAAGYNHSDSMTKEENDARELKPFLELVPRNSLRNPVVEKVLNQMVHIVNEIIREYGKPDEVRIELARELKKTNSKRKEMSDAISKNEKRNEEIKKIIEGEGLVTRATKNDILKYRLYEELKDNGYKTLYSGTYIKREKLFSREFNIEHIIPKAKLFNDAYANKTLETDFVNKEKGSLTAMDYMVSKGESAVQNYKNIIENLFMNKAISKAKRDFLLMKESEIPSDFLNRDLSESQYIAKEATTMLKEVFRNVYTTTGSITKRLREDWGLVDVLKEINWEKYERLGMTEIYQDKDGRKIRRIKDWSKRDDHRHHAVDALVIALTKPAYIQYLNNLAASTDETSHLYGIRKKYLETDNGHLKFKSPIANIRSEAKKHLDRMFISTKVNSKVTSKSLNKTTGHTQAVLTPRGQLHDQTMCGRRWERHVQDVKIDGKMTRERINEVTNPTYRHLLLQRLEQFGDDPKKAFAGKNSLQKNPIWIDEANGKKVPEKVKTVTFEEIFSVKKKVDKDLNIEAVLDEGVKRILKQRLEQFGNDKTKAFSNLDENPIWLDEKSKTPIKKVVTKAKGNSMIAIHDKQNHKGEPMLGKDDIPMSKDYVMTNNNHHAAFYIDESGKVRENVVSLFEAVERKKQGLSIINKDYNSELGWKFLFSAKKDEYFVFPDPSNDFYPQEIDLKDSRYAEIISKNLFRLQSISSGDYIFRHHLESKLRDDSNLGTLVKRRIRLLDLLRDIVKVRINHLGEIVKIGE